MFVAFTGTAAFGTAAAMLPANSRNKLKKPKTRNYKVLPRKVLSIGMWGMGEIFTVGLNDFGGWLLLIHIRCGRVVEHRRRSCTRGSCAHLIHWISRVSWRLLLGGYLRNSIGIFGNLLLCSNARCWIRSGRRSGVLLRCSVHQLLQLNTRKFHLETNYCTTRNFYSQSENRYFLFPYNSWFLFSKLIPFTNAYHEEGKKLESIFRPGEKERNETRHGIRKYCNIIIELEDNNGRWWKKDNWTRWNIVGRKENKWKCLEVEQELENLKGQRERGKIRQQVKRKNN